MAAVVGGVVGDMVAEANLSDLCFSVHCSSPWRLLMLMQAILWSKAFLIISMALWQKNPAPAFILWSFFKFNPCFLCPLLFILICGPGLGDCWFRGLLV